MPGGLRAPDQLREVSITPNFLSQATGSCLIEVGKTRVVCSAMLEDSVPPFLKGSKTGWLTAEYSMLPASSLSRIRRERSNVGGRTHEIQRLIGRSLRSCLSLAQLGERSILIDCDVLDADGGTRTASVTGGFVALVLALRNSEAKIPGILNALKRAVAAVSVGVIDGQVYLDLDYNLDKRAEVDMNVVKTSTQEYVEIQGTAEAAPYSAAQLQQMLSVADKGIARLFECQQKALSL